METSANVWDNFDGWGSGAPRHTSTPTSFVPPCNNDASYNAFSRKPEEARRTLTSKAEHPLANGHTRAKAVVAPLLGDASAAGARGSVDAQPKPSKKAEETCGEVRVNPDRPPNLPKGMIKC
jgi:hypothetical protein